MRISHSFNSFLPSALVERGSQYSYTPVSCCKRPSVLVKERLVLLLDLSTQHVLPTAAASWELVRNADAPAPPSPTESEPASS